MTSFTKTEVGVVVSHKQHKDKAWGLVYSDGHSKAYGWVDILEATIHNPKYCLYPTDITYKPSGYYDELYNYGKLIEVEVVTTITLKGS